MSTTFSHACGSFNLWKCQQRDILIIPSFRFFVVSCMLSTFLVSTRSVISIYSILVPVNEHGWKYVPFRSKLGIGVIKPTNFILLFPQFFSIVMAHLSYCIRSHLKGVVVDQLQWHLPINVIKTRTIRTPAFWGYPPPPHDYPHYWVMLDPKSKQGRKTLKI